MVTERRKWSEGQKAKKGFIGPVCPASRGGNAVTPSSQTRHREVEQRQPSGARAAVLITAALVVTAVSIAMLPRPAYIALFAAAALASTLVHLLRVRRTRPSENDLRTALELIAGQIIAAESEIERMQSLMRTWPGSMLPTPRLQSPSAPAGVSTGGAHADR